MIYFIHFLHKKKEETEKIKLLFNKVLHINVSGKNCYRHYVKFNSNLNNTGKKTFIEEIDFNNNIYEKQSDRKLNQNFGYYFTFLSIKFDHFYKNPLDDKIINEINNFFSINIPIDQAKELHNRWIFLNKKSENN